MRARSLHPLAASLAALASAGALAACGSGDGGDPGQAYVRLNQVGYEADGHKEARLLSARPALKATFEVRDQSSGNPVMSGQVGRDLGRWSSRFPHAYAIDFSALTQSGAYDVVVKAADARSPPFRVGAALTLYSSLAVNAVRFLRAQRDGPDVDPKILNRRPTHLADRRAFVYATPSYRREVLVGGLHRLGGPVDVSGGWMDAGDTLKYAETSSFTEALLLYVLRDHPQALGQERAAAEDEARFGMDWLLKLWRHSSGPLIYQVGLGEGNGKTILGAHDTTWRLPQVDDQLKAAPGTPEHFVKYRPAFRAAPPGQGLSPNLGGRMAAAFALGAQVFRSRDPGYAKHCLRAARTVLASATTRPVRKLVTSTPHDFYPEVEWRDDMEFGAIELYLALAPRPGNSGARAYLREAGRWAHAYAESPFNGTDSLNLYDVASLAHLDLSRAMQRAHLSGIAGVSRATLAADLDDQLRLAERRAARDPFSLGVPYKDDDTVSHALGLAVESRLADELTRSRRYEDFALAQRDFVLGDNAWGMSFVVGAGSSFPHCLHHPVANLEGSLDGSPPVLLGATVPGPVKGAELGHLSLSKGYRPCPPGGGDAFGPFSGRDARYEDNVVSSPTAEPSIDLAALALVTFAQEAGR